MASGLVVRRPGSADAVIGAATLLAVALRLYQLSRPPYLFGVTGYDDGSDYGSAVLLVHGYLPYRDFIIVQPPGITLLMAPVAALTKGMGTAAGLGAARVLTALAGGAATGLAGLLVRHRGRLAVLATCGVAALFPDGIQAAHTVLLEPWLVLLCLLGALTLFDGDTLTTSWPRLVEAGAAFGVAGAIKAWAVLPVAVVCVLLLGTRRWRSAAGFLTAVGVAFLVVVAPFAVMAPRAFYRSVVIAQLFRVDTMRTPIGYRVAHMAGLSDFRGPAPPVVGLVTALLLVLIVASAVIAWRLAGQRPSPLDLFAFGTTTLIVVAFLWPPDFYAHYSGFLAPFLALAIGLPLARMVDALGAGVGRDGAEVVRRQLSMVTATVTALVLLVLAVVQVHHERSLLRPAHRTGLALDVARVKRLVPWGSCVLTDKASLTIAANRLLSSRPGCVPIVDGVGSDYSLSGGLNGATGAGRVPAVRDLWLSAMSGAQYVWLSPTSSQRIPWDVPAIADYFQDTFVPVPGVTGLYARRTAWWAQRDSNP